MQFCWNCEMLSRLAFFPKKKKEKKILSQMNKQHLAKKYEQKIFFGKLCIFNFGDLVSQ